MSRPITMAAVLAATYAAAIGATARAQVADSGPARAMEAPGDTRPVQDKFWWSDDWFERGRIAPVTNHEVERREISYVDPADNTEVPAQLFRPKTPGKYPAVLFAHGRRGIDELTSKVPMRLAARGFVVLVPNAYAARFIAAMPVEHDAALEGDMAAGIDHLLTLPDVSTHKACLVSHTRGGYMTLRAAVTLGRQDKNAACYVSYYPHWQNPNLGEPDQVYRYASEVDRLVLPTMIFIGEFEQYQRRREIETGVAAMRAAKRDVRLIIYPGVGRGFDFRPANVRTFADDLAAKDAMARTAEFIARHLREYTK